MSRGLRNRAEGEDDMDRALTSRGDADPDQSKGRRGRAVFRMLFFEVGWVRTGEARWQGSSEQRGAAEEKKKKK